MSSLPENNSGILIAGEELDGGIWPKSKTLRMAVFYMALFIVRPWEVLFPALAVLKPERVFAILMLLAIVSSGKSTLRMTWQTITIFFFISVIFISGLFAYEPLLAWDSLYKYISFFIFYLVLLMVVNSPYDLIFMVISYISIMCLYLAKSQWEYFVHGRHRYTMGVSRLIGIENTFGGPNALAMSIVVTLPFALLLWRNRKVISEPWSEVWQKRFRRGLIIYGVLAVSSIILTNSRSGMAITVVFCAVLMMSGKGIGQKIKFIFFGTMVLFFVWTFMPSESRYRFETIWNSEAGPANAQESADGRVEGFKAGMEMFHEFPFLGVGAGNFVPYRVHHLDGVKLEAHNLPGQLMGEMGLLGVVTFLMVLGAVVGNCRKVIHCAKNNSDHTIKVLCDLARACLLSLFLLLLLGAAGHNLYRYNWLWIAAFSLLALHFVQGRIKILVRKG